MKESIPPILRPESVRPVAVADIAQKFGLSGDISSSVLVTGISMNTNDLRAGDLFVAMPGLNTHGAKFVAAAIERGAAAVITDAQGAAALGEQIHELGVPLLLLEEPRGHLGQLAAFVYGNYGPGQPRMFGTTGTNGKTSTSYLLEALLRQCGEITGLTSTAERHIAGEVIVSRLTTPEFTGANRRERHPRGRHDTGLHAGRFAHVQQLQVVTRELF